MILSTLEAEFIEPCFRKTPREGCHELVVENLDLIFRSFEKSTKVEDDDGADTKLDSSMLIDFFLFLISN